MNDSKEMLTSHQAYLCMFEFLLRLYKRAPSDEMGGLLGSLSLFPDGQPADQALASDWSGVVTAVLTAEACGGYAEAAFRLG